jgi:hypothetical protein
MSLRVHGIAHGRSRRRRRGAAVMSWGALRPRPRHGRVCATSARRTADTSCRRRCVTRWPSSGYRPTPRSTARSRTSIASSMRVNPPPCSQPIGEAGCERTVVEWVTWKSWAARRCRSSAARQVPRWVVDDHGTSRTGASSPVSGRSAERSRRVLRAGVLGGRRPRRGRCAVCSSTVEPRWCPKRDEAPCAAAPTPRCPAPLRRRREPGSGALGIHHGQIELHRVNTGLGWVPT